MATITGTTVEGMSIQAEYSHTQNASANTSTVVVTLKLVNHYALYASALNGSYISVGGNKTNYSKSISYGGSSTTSTTLATKTVTVTHNSDGTGTCNISGTFVMNGTYRSTYISTMTVNSTITLPKIARASGLTVPSSVNTGAALSGTVTPSSTAFNHKVQLKIGSTVKDTITLAVGTKTFSYTIPHSWFPSSTSGTITTVLQTYNGSTLVASVSKNVTANVPTSVVPSVSAFTAAIAASGLSGLYVQGKTTAKLTATATAGSGSSIKSYTYTGPNVTASANTATVTANTVTTSSIKSSGTLTYKVEVQDARGRKASKTLTISVQPYSPPKIGAISVQRCTSNGTISDSGTYARYTVNSTYSSVGGKNTRTVTVAYSSNGGSSYSAATTLQAATDTSGSKTGTYGGGAFALANSYVIRFTITDAYGATHSVTAQLQSAARPININWNGKGVSIGAMSTKEAFEVSMPAEFNDNLIAKGDLTINGKLTLNSSFNHYGIGGRAKEVTGDWNTACGQFSGIYMGNNMTNAPSTGWYYVIHMAHNSLYQTQIAYAFNGVNKIYCRNLVNGTWNSWETMLNSNNTKDFVVEQETSGVWTYRKWNNGTAECWGTLNGTLSPYTTINGFSAYEGSVSFPSNLFTAIPNVQFQPYIGNGFAIPARGVISTTTQCKWVALSNVSTANTTVKIDVFAIGKWK